MLVTLHKYIFRELLRVFMFAAVGLTLILSLGSILQPVQEYGVGPRELCKPGGLASLQPLAWTPDGQALLFTKRVPEGGRELWLIPIDNGPARRLCGPRELMCQGMMYGSVHSALDMHPDGERIAFDCFEYRHEVWAMENFLPEAVAMGK